MDKVHRFTSSRRRFFQKISLLSVSTFFSRFSYAETTKTPRATEGPFYPTSSMRSNDIDNDLVKISDRVETAGGEVITLKGVVMDTDLSPLSDVRVEIWQCDVNGHYLHTADNNPVAYDSGFQGFGHTITNQQGEYEFRTIKPVSYPGRTPHIHVKLFRGDKVLTTQFYIKAHPDNSGDSLYRKMSKSERMSVEMEFVHQSSTIETTVNVIC